MAEKAARIDELWVRAQIHDVLLRYCRGVDRKDFALMRSAYHDDAYDDHGPYRGDVPGLIDWVQQRAVRVEQSQHIIANCLIEFNGDVAAVETYCVVHQRITGEGNERPLQVTITLRYADLFENRDGAWRIARRVCITETEQSCPAGASVHSGLGTVQRRDSGDAMWAIRESAGFSRPSL
jgi:SnoaL-like domain